MAGEETGEATGKATGRWRARRRARRREHLAAVGVNKDKLLRMPHVVEHLAVRR